MCDDPFVKKKAVNNGVETSFEVNQGTPRYLAWGKPRNGQHPPTQLQDCELLVQIERVDVFAAVAGEFLLEDSPVSVRDFVPGLTREKNAENDYITPLAGVPVLTPTKSVVLSNVALTLPSKLVRVLKASLGDSWFKSGAISLKVSKHNGYRFLTNEKEIKNFKINDINRENVIAPDATETCVFENVPCDYLVALIVEVVYRAPGNETAEGVCLGWAPVAPFTKPTTDSSTNKLAEERDADIVTELVRTRGSRDEPCVDWRQVVDAPSSVWATAARLGASAANKQSETDQFSFAATLGEGGVAEAEPAPVPVPEPEPVPQLEPVPVPEPEQTTAHVPAPAPPPPAPEPPVQPITLDISVMPETPNELASLTWRLTSKLEAQTARLERIEAMVDVPIEKIERMAETLAEPEVMDPTTAPATPTRPALAQIASKMEEQMQRMERMEQMLEQVASPGKSPALVGRHEKYGTGDAEAHENIGEMFSPSASERGEFPSEGPAALGANAARVLFGDATDASLRKTSSGIDKLVLDSEPSAVEEAFQDVGSLTSPQLAGVGGFSRATRARLHASGADAALPPDVRLALKSGSANPVNSSESDLPSELSDSLDVNDVVVQLLAYREFEGQTSASASNDGDSTIGSMTDAGDAPQKSSASTFNSARFTFNFFDFPLSTSRVCGLTKSKNVGDPRLLVPTKGGGGTTGFESRWTGEAWFHFRVDPRVGNGSGDRLDVSSDKNSDNSDSKNDSSHRRESFVKYLHHGPPVMVDVFDGNSLLQKGVCVLDVRSLLRKGRDTVDTLVEAPVFDHSVTNEIEEKISVQKKIATGLPQNSSQDVSKQPIGALLVRLINVGRRRGDVGGRDVGAFSHDEKKSRPIRSKEILAVPEAGGEIVASMLRGFDVSGKNHTDVSDKTPPAPSTKKVRSFVRKSLTSSGVSTGRRKEGDVQPKSKQDVDVKSLETTTTVRSTLEEQELRKLTRERRLLEIRNGKSSAERDDTDVSSDDLKLSVRSKVLDVVDAARKRQKRVSILKKLRESAKTKITIRPAYGELIFFEFPFRNPDVSKNKVFEIRCDDGDISIVMDAEERTVLRSSSGIASCTDATTRNDQDSETNRFDGTKLFLSPHELMDVAFKFQSFESFVSKDGVLDSTSLHLKPRTVSIHFVDEEDSRNSKTLVVDVKPRSMLIHRTYRFHAGEHDFWKMQSRVHDLLTQGNQGTPTHPQVRVSDPAVAATVTGSSQDENSEDQKIKSKTPEIVLRVKCGSSDDDAQKTKTFFVCVYGDKFLGTLIATWRVVLHVAPKIDLAATVGQTTRTSVLVKGFDSKRERRVVAFSSSENELQILPSQFTIPPAVTKCSYPGKKDIAAEGVTEMQITFRPLLFGGCQHVIHLVDSETGALVHTKIVQTEARRPFVSKSFDVTLRLNQETHKNIQYTNPYPKPKAFILRCTHPGLLVFRPGMLDLAAAGTKGATAPMGLTFAPSEMWEKAMAVNGDSSTADSSQAHGEAPHVTLAVFINDEEDATEECFEIRVFAGEE